MVDKLRKILIFKLEKSYSEKVYRSQQLTLTYPFLDPAAKLLGILCYRVYELINSLIHVSLAGLWSHSWQIYLGCPAVIPQLAVTITRFIFGWDYSRVLVCFSQLEFQLADFALIASALVSQLFPSCASS